MNASRVKEGLLIWFEHGYSVKGMICDLKGEASGGGVRVFYVRQNGITDEMFI